MQRLRDERKDQDFQPAMPLVECGNHLLDYFWAWGPTLAGAMGDAPLTHSELVACQANTGVDLSSWEAATLIRLSREYLGETHRAVKRDCPPPFGAPDVKHSRDREQARRLQMFLG